MLILHDDGPTEIRVESQRFGDFTAQVDTEPRLSTSVDAVLVTVKATQLESALTRVPTDALAGALVVPFLNGIDHVDLLRRVYPPDSVVPATIRIETTKIGDGVIRHTSPFALVEIGPHGEAVAAHLRAAGIDVKIREDEHAMLWSKMAVLAPMALLTTHERANVGAVRAGRKEDLAAVVREFAAVANAEGAAMDADMNLAFLDTMPDAMETSMQRDQAAGRPLELDALGNALLRRAAKAGVDAPVTKRLVGDLQARTNTSA